MWLRALSIQLGLLLLSLVIAERNAVADIPDMYIGDSAIYSATGNENYPRPNVLFIIDNHMTMGDSAGSGAPYNPATPYSGSYGTWSVYKRTGLGNMVLHISLASQAAFTAAIRCTAALDALADYGNYTGTASTGLKSDGTCGNGGADTVYLGNLLNYNQQPQSTPVTGDLTAVQGSAEITGTNTLFTTEPSHPTTPGLSGYSIQIDNVIYTVTTVIDATHLILDRPFESANGTYQAEIPFVTGSQIDILRQAVRTVVGGKLGAARFGLMTFDGTKRGGRLVFPVSALDSTSFNTTFLPLLNGTAANGITPVSGEGRPLAGGLYDAGAYFRGTARLPISREFITAPSPIEYPCQQNFIFVLTNGDTVGEDLNEAALTSMQILSTDTGGDVDHDGMEETAYGSGTHFLDDVAKYYYETDSRHGTTTINGVVYDFDGDDFLFQNITTHTVLIFSPHKELLERAADGSHGRGAYRVASSASQLQNALENALADIVAQVDSSFVAPVVPVSPENRTYSGSRVYMGFFKPQSSKYWIGNIKKFGIDAEGNIIDRNGALASYVDLNKDNRDDRDDEFLSGAKDGEFRSCALSYWTTDTLATPCYGDAGQVDVGGVGEKLMERTTERKIYSFLYGGDLTSPVNAVELANVYDSLSNPSGKITPSVVDLAWAANPVAATRNLVSWIRGVDIYDEDGDGVRTDKRKWLFGDVLHSKPHIVNYNSFNISDPANEMDCAVNKSMIFAGSNDGMLHAIRDCDGSEAWAFIPTETMAELRWLQGTSHVYNIDSSVTSYIYDRNQNGVIESLQGDKVFLLFGARRGSGKQNNIGYGWYYFLNVTNPEAPAYWWKMTSSVPEFNEMGESWSEPKIGKIRLGGSDKIVAFIGGGYDNCNEDGRYGNTRLYQSICVGRTTPDAGVVVNPYTTGAMIAPKGRGIYVVEIATLGADGSPSFTNTRGIIWSYTAWNGSLVKCVPADLAPIDSNYDGYVDRIYVVDIDANVWRFDIGADAVASWSGRKIFSSNPTSYLEPDTGRKVFYRAAVTLELDSAMVFFGTGDREHPLNRAVVDRMYAIYDRGQTTTKYEANLVDVTDNLIQTGTPQQVADTLAALADPTKYGWFIKLNESSGEKILAQPLVYNKYLYFTSFAPNVTLNTNVCQAGNLGMGGLYVLDYKTGAAVLNYDRTNDSTYDTYSSNSYATPTDGTVLLRSDRKKTLGGGIPSPPVPITTASGDTSIIVGCGGAICTGATGLSGGVVPIYWRQK